MIQKNIYRTLTYEAQQQINETKIPVLQKLKDTDNSMLVPEGRGIMGLIKGVKYVMTEHFTLGGGHTMQYTDDRLYHRLLHSKPI